MLYPLLFKHAAWPVLTDRKWKIFLHHILGSFYIYLVTNLFEYIRCIVELTEFLFAIQDSWSHLLLQLCQQGLKRATSPIQCKVGTMYLVWGYTMSSCWCSHCSIISLISCIYKAFPAIYSSIKKSNQKLIKVFMHTVYCNDRANIFVPALECRSQAFQSWDKNVGLIDQTPSPPKYKEGVWGRDYFYHSMHCLPIWQLWNQNCNSKNLNISWKTWMHWSAEPSLHKRYFERIHLSINKTQP